MDKDISFELLTQYVERTIALNEEGLDMAQISEHLNLPIEDIQTILICAQGFVEDDAAAVARLVEMS